MIYNTAILSLSLSYLPGNIDLAFGDGCLADSTPVFVPKNEAHSEC